MRFILSLRLYSSFITSGPELSPTASMCQIIHVVQFDKKMLTLSMTDISAGSGLFTVTFQKLGAQWLSGRVLDSRPKGRGFKPHRRHCVVSLSKNINPSLVLVQPRNTRPFITERVLMGRKESNQTKHFRN